MEHLYNPSTQAKMETDKYGHIEYKGRLCYLISCIKNSKYIKFKGYIEWWHTMSCMYDLNNIKYN